MAVPPLRALVAGGWDVAAVVTRADARRGRGSGLSPSPVKAAAEELGLPVVHRVEEVLDLDADLGVVVAYGALVRRPVLERLPMVNLHFSLLPRWRGAAPVERALLAGDRETGVCLMQLEEGLDTGPVFACRTVAIGARTTAAELRSRAGGDGHGAAGRFAARRVARLRGRRRASRPTPTSSTRPSCSSTGGSRRPCSTGSSASAGRGRRSGAGA